MEKDREDKTRLLDTTRSSDDDLEGFDLSDGDHTSPRGDAVESLSYSDSLSLTEYKEQEQLEYAQRRTSKRRCRCSWVALNRLCYCITLFAFLLLAYCLGTVYGWRIGRDASVTIGHHAQKWVKPEGFKVVGLVFCQCIKP